MYECMSIYDDCNRRLDEAETNQPPLDLKPNGNQMSKTKKIRIADTSQSGADQLHLQSMPSAEAITNEVCRGLGSSDSEKLEVNDLSCT
jgi:hypothetical protein